MKRFVGAFGWAALGLTALGVIACSSSSPDVDADSFDTTSCEGAAWDDNGICRKPSGRFAKKACCEQQPDELVLPHAEARQNLDAYACPEGADTIKVAFFDADSTLRISRSGNFTAREREDVFILPFVVAEVERLNEEGYLVAAVSNQGGVASGVTPIEVAEGALVFVAEQLHGVGAKIDYLDFAPEKDEFRKPKTGMADMLVDKLEEKCGIAIDWESSFMVGDAGYKRNVDGPHPDGRPADDFSNSDRGFAENLGIPFSEPTDYFGWRQWETFNLRYKNQLLALYDGMEEEIAALEESGDDDERKDMLIAELAQNRELNDFD